MGSVSPSCVKSALPACPCIILLASAFLLGINSLHSSWEYIITFACYEGNGLRSPRCKARGNIHSAIHSLSQARGSRGGNPDSVFPSKVWGEPPPHSQTLASCVLLRAHSPWCPLLLWQCLEVKKKKAGIGGVTWYFMLVSTRECKQRTSVVPVSLSEGAGRLVMGQENHTFCLVLAFPWSCNTSLPVINTVGLFAGSSVKSASFCLI